MIKNIEFLRIIGIMAIVLLHIFHSIHGIYNLNLNIDIYDKLHKMTENGQKGVDLFFILSGLFFYLGLIANPTQSLSNFIKKKLIRMWPVMIFTVIVAFVASLFGVIKFKYYDNIYSLLFLNGLAVSKIAGNIGNTWYCSVLLFHFILFFYLLKNFNIKKVILVIAIGIYISYSIILQNKNFQIDLSKEIIFYIFNIGMLRAWGGIGIGMFIALWYKTNEKFINNFSPKKTNKVIITFFELILLYFTINNLMLHKFKHYNHFMFILVFTALIALFMCNKGYISQLLNKDIFSKLSKYVYSIFITHGTIMYITRNLLWIPHKDFVINYPILNLIIILFFVIIVGVLTYHFVEKPAKKYLQNIWFKN